MNDQVDRLIRTSPDPREMFVGTRIVIGAQIVSGVMSPILDVSIYIGNL